LNLTQAARVILFSLIIERERERERERGSNNFVKYYEVKQVGFTLDKKKELIAENDLDEIISEKATFQKITKRQLENNH
jgi:hypothetical protein